MEERWWGLHLVTPGTEDRRRERKVQNPGTRLVPRTKSESLDTPRGDRSRGGGSSGSAGCESGKWTQLGGSLDSLVTEGSLRRGLWARDAGVSSPRDQNMHDTVYVL